MDLIKQIQKGQVIRFCIAPYTGKKSPIFSFGNQNQEDNGRIRTTRININGRFWRKL